MNERQQNLRIGIFVTIGLFLLVAVLFYLGLSELFVTKVKLYTYFSESVQGLTVGSSVKYRGVPVGSVSQLTISMESQKVFVIMEIEPRYFGKSMGKDRQSGLFFAQLQKEIEQGLRCRMEFAGITGMKFIDFDYFSPPGPLPEKAGTVHPELPGVRYIPSVQSTIKDLSGALSGSLERLSRIRFEEIANELERSLSRLSEILSDPAIRSAIGRINDAAENLEVSTSTVARVFDERRLTRLLDSLEKDMEVFRLLGEQLSADTSNMRLPESTAAFRTALRNLIESKEDLGSSLSKFNQTLESIRMLTDYLSTDPSSIIKGKKEKPVEK